MSKEELLFCPCGSGEIGKYILREEDEQNGL